MCFLSTLYSQFLITPTLRFVLQNITACVIVNVSYRSHSVSNFHSSFSTATKNCLMPSNVNSSLNKENHNFSSVFKNKYLHQNNCVLEITVIRQYTWEFQPKIRLHYASALTLVLQTNSGLLPKFRANRFEY